MDLTNVPPDRILKVCSKLPYDALSSFIDRITEQNPGSAALKPCQDRLTTMVPNPDDPYAIVEHESRILARQYLQKHGNVNTLFILTFSKNKIQLADFLISDEEIKDDGTYSYFIFDLVESSPKDPTHVIQALILGTMELGDPNLILNIFPVETFNYLDSLLKVDNEDILSLFLRFICVFADVLNYVEFFDLLFEKYNHAKQFLTMLSRMGRINMPVHFMSKYLDSSFINEMGRNLSKSNVNYVLDTLSQTIYYRHILLTLLLNPDIHIVQKVLDYTQTLYPILNRLGYIDDGDLINSITNFTGGNPIIPQTIPSIGQTFNVFVKFLKNLDKLYIFNLLEDVLANFKQLLDSTREFMDKTIGGNDILLSYTLDNIKSEYLKGEFSDNDIIKDLKKFLNSPDEYRSISKDVTRRRIIEFLKDIGREDLLESVEI